MMRLKKNVPLQLVFCNKMAMNMFNKRNVVESIFKKQKEEMEKEKRKQKNERWKPRWMNRIHCNACTIVSPWLIHHLM